MMQKYRRNIQKIEKAAHPCNQFLLEKFVAFKRVADVQKQENLSGCYRKIIMSLQKYPIPIICFKQACTLEGVGEKMAKVIKQMVDLRYSQFIERMDFSEVHQAALESQQQTIPCTESQSLPSGVISLPEKSTLTEPIQKAVSNLSLIERILNRSHQKEQRQMKYPQPEDSSQTNTKDRVFKIKKQSSSYFFLKAFDGDTNIVLSKKTIKERVEQIFEHNIANWSFINRLQSHRFIEVVREGYKLLPEGVLVISKELKSSKSLIYRNLLSELQSRNIQLFKEEKVERKLVKKDSLGKYKLILIIDNREVKIEDFREYFNLKLVEEQGLPCRHQNMSLGDFGWVLETENGDKLVLDYIIQRKISSDLASSIMDGRYKEQRFRLSNCGISNIFYIYQGSYSANISLPQKALQKALRSIQFKSGFKVLRTTDIRHTIRYLIAMHQHIQQTISNSQEIMTVSTFSTFNSVNSKSNVPMNFVFGQMLKCIPGANKDTVELIISKFKSMRDLYLSVRTLPVDERIHFLKTLINRNKSGESVANILIKILYD